MTPAAALQLSGITKRYDTVLALDDVSLTVRPGTIHAVLGENGAGKTTLMRIVYGMVRADAGKVEIGGVGSAPASPLDAIRAGVGMVHQHFTLVPAMTVAENLALGGHGRLRAGAMRKDVEEIARRTGFSLDPDATVETLPVGAQQRVEIAKALARKASLLILDEPTAVLAPAEIEDLLGWLRAYSQGGNAVLLITHKLREAIAIADDVTVLRQGRVVFSGQAASTSVEHLTTAMIGESVSASMPHPERRVSVAAYPVFAASMVSVAGADGRTVIHEASFSVGRGEIVGIAAVEGAGQYELLRALAGRLPVSAGTLARPASVGFIPEDRHRDAVMLDRSLTENIALRGAATRHGVMDWPAWRGLATQLMAASDVRAPGEHTRMRALSGGNQQKLIVARELAPQDGTMPEALVVENPTRGLDVRAMVDVHGRLRAAAADGAAVVVYSSDLDEVLSLASRVLVVYAGRVREVEANREDIGRAMIGLT